MKQEKYIGMDVHQATISLTGQFGRLSMSAMAVYIKQVTAPTRE
jgi:hypothetical protein